jgi:fructose-specific phosphotransferase system IIA component
MLDPACIDLNLKAKRKPELIEELVTLLNQGGKISDADRLTTEVVEREKLASTGIGRGIAIPHALSTTVTETVLAFGRHKGARFDAVDNKPVKLFFLLVGPEGTQAEHLRVLSRLARYLHDDAFCNALRNASAPAEVIAAIESKEQSAP